MKTISSFRDLQNYGINPLTGEACSLSMRTLCDLSDSGRQLLATFLGAPDLDCFPENWNTHVGNEAAVCSAMLTRATLRDLCIFALFVKDECTAVLERGGTFTGLTVSDEYCERYMSIAREQGSGYTIHINHAAARTDRNTHAATGRTI